MCGIAGLFDTRGHADLGRLHRMAQVLRHRGPDDQGMVLVDPDTGRAFTHGGPDTPRDAFASPLPYAPGRGTGAPGDATYRLGLVHRRLSIVDLSPGGHQPMCDAGGRTWITYNGEIYNFVELRAELEQAGARFVSTSDTEVILAAYARWGRDCLHHFNGMFALAIWDGERRELFCARDRLGVKPFYYQWDGERFAFASEPKALVLTQPRRITPHLAAVRDLLALDWVDHGSGTFFEGLRQLPAGHCIVLGEGRFAIRRWWALDPSATAAGGTDDHVREYERLFTDAVRIRLRADVEVGSCLSGGLDSSAVVTTAAMFAPKGLHAFTCAYDEGPSFDERPYVRAVAEATGARSHVVVPDGADFWSVFDTLAMQQDEPTAGPGLFSQWKVMELAHGAGLKVLLDGQGGDETLAGYFRYLPARLRDHVSNGEWSAFANLWSGVSDRLGFATTLLHTFEPFLPAPLVEAMRRRWGQGKDRVLGRALASLPSEAPRPAGTARSFLWRQLEFDTIVRQLPSLLRYEDRNSMAFAIETRLPFLDYRLVEFAFSLPDDAKLEGTTTKAVLRRAMAERIPRAVLDRRDKMGFETPTDLWLRGKHSAEVRRRLSRPGPFQDWVDRRVMADQLEDYLAGRRAIGLQVWRWLALESWSQQMIAADPRFDRPSPIDSPHAGRHLSYIEARDRYERDVETGSPVA